MGETLGTVFGTEGEKQDLGSEVTYFLLLGHLIHPEQLYPRHSTCRGCFPSAPLSPLHH